MAPSPENVVLAQRDTSNEWHDRGVNLAIISITMSAMATCLVAVRLITRYDFNRKKVKGIGADDVAISGSLLCAIGLTIANCISTNNGIGKKASDLDQHHLFLTLQTFWAAQVTYKFTINLTKTSICLLYLRVFGHEKRFRHCVYCVLVYVVAYAVASIVATIFQCVPIPRIWNKNIPGTCINLLAFWYSNAAANIIGDVVIFLLPLRQIAALQMPANQKVGIILIFALGLFVCVTSVLRMTTLKTGSQNKDQTFGTLNSTIWTTIEANTGIICACLPMLKTPLARLLPRYFPQGSQGSAESNPHSGHAIPASRNAHRAPPTTPNWKSRWLSSNASRGARDYPQWDNHGMPIRLTPKPAMPPSPSSASYGTATYPAEKPSQEISSASLQETNRVACPKNVITKATSMDVQYADERGYPASLPKVLHPNDKEHNRSTSNLVGNEYSNVNLD